MSDTQLTSETFTAEITDLAFGGDGVCRTPDGMAVFVPFTIIGDRVQVELQSLHGSYARGRATRIASPGPGRTPPACPYYQQCGGCQYQHIEYELQLEFKQRQLTDLLSRIAKLSTPPALSTPVPSPAAYGYRNKLVLEPVNAATPPSPGTPLEYGFCRCDSKAFIPVASCPLARPEINNLLPTALSSGAALRNARRPHPGNLLLRSPAASPPFFHFGTPPARHMVKEQLCGREVIVPARSFWQVNPAVANALVESTAAAFGRHPTKYLIDAYAGAGAFSLAMGEQPEQTLLIERDSAALAAAKVNHQEWKLGNRDFLEGCVESVLAKAVSAIDQPGKSLTVLLDPPRSGCSPAVITALTATPPAHASCNNNVIAKLELSKCHPNSSPRP